MDLPRPRLTPESSSQGLPASTDFEDLIDPAHFGRSVTVSLHLPDGQGWTPNPEVVYRSDLIGGPQNDDTWRVYMLPDKPLSYYKGHGTLHPVYFDYGRVVPGEYAVVIRADIPPKPEATSHLDTSADQAESPNA